MTNQYSANEQRDRFHAWPVNHSGFADWSKASRSRSAPRGRSVEKPWEGETDYDYGVMGWFS